MTSNYGWDIVNSPRGDGDYIINDPGFIEPARGENRKVLEVNNVVPIGGRVNIRYGATCFQPILGDCSNITEYSSILLFGFRCPFGKGA